MGVGFGRRLFCCSLSSLPGGAGRFSEMPGLPDLLASLRKLRETIEEVTKGDLAPSDRGSR
jgi:hypothetical protein